MDRDWQHLALLCKRSQLVNEIMSKILVYSLSSAEYKNKIPQRVELGYSKDLEELFCSPIRACQSCTSKEYEVVDIMTAALIEYIKKTRQYEREQFRRENIPYFLFRLTGHMPQTVIQLDGAEIFKIRFPEEDFIGIKTLILDFNSLRSLPESIESLSMLRILSLKGNKLCKLPRSMAKMQNLKEMYLAENLFTKFPRELLLLKLKILDISHNKVQFIPKGLSNSVFLHTINARDNQLSFLPSDILRVVSLRVMDFEDNPFFQTKEMIYRNERTLTSHILENEAFTQDALMNLPVVPRSQLSAMTKCELCGASIPQNQVTVYKRRKNGRIYPYGFNECRRHPQNENERLIVRFNRSNHDS